MEETDRMGKTEILRKTEGEETNRGEKSCGRKVPGKGVGGCGGGGSGCGGCCGLRSLRYSHGSIVFRYDNANKL